MKVLFLITYVLVFSNCKISVDYWTEFKVIYEKTYSNPIEDRFRFLVFNETYNMINNHNAKYKSGEVSYFLRINKFADLTDAEFNKTYLTYNSHVGQLNLTLEFPEPTLIPESIDWRKKGAVSSVQEQGYCESSHIFSALGAIESQNYIKHNVSIALSEQEILDCNKHSTGCHGGSVNQVFDYVKDNGISFYSSYPYYEKTQKCKKGKDSGVKINGFVEVPGNEKALKQAIGSVGPISVGINLGHLRYYGGGIVDDPQCSKTLYHAALAVGYGTEKGVDYWIIKNSWGKIWGEFGYVRLRRNINQQCGISLQNFYPVLD